MTKREALRTARELRAQGQTVKVYKITSLFTIPGRGFDGVCVDYVVRQV